MTRLTLRLYAEADRDEALAVFDANVPKHFGVDEREWFEDSLDDLEGPAFVAVLDGEVVAFGGYEIWDYYDKALLYWGMAHPRVQGRGVGGWMLAERLARIAREDPPTRWVTVDTSPRVAPFFVSQGFEAASVWPHGYRAGGTMHVMRYDLAATTPEALDARAAAAYAGALAKLTRTPPP